MALLIKELSSMLSYFDILFIRTYKQYIKWNAKDIPGVYSIFVLSLFQTLNLLSILFLILGITKKESWYLEKFYITLITLSIALFNYIRIYHIIGLKNLFTKYENRLNNILHPVLYFIISISILIILRLINYFPVIVKS